MSTRGRRDLTEAAIVAALLKAGCDVRYAEKQPYDLLVGRARQTYLLEIKSALGKLTSSQVEFLKDWRGHYAVVKTAQQALNAVGL